jgi:hypothetical protein
MSTPAQISANQRNAQSSTGPCTDAGKALCSQNGVSHGLSSNFSVLAHESQSEFDALLASLRAEFSPATENDQFLVGEMAQSRWKMQRIDRLETRALDLIVLGDDASDNSPDGRIVAALSKNGRDPLPLLNRYRTTAERSYYKALNQLHKSRRDDQSSEQKALDDFITSYIYDLPTSRIGSASQSPERTPSFELENQAISGGGTRSESN